jgi:hypothetical protein
LDKNIGITLDEKNKYIYIKQLSMWATVSTRPLRSARKNGWDEISENTALEWVKI